uniref:C-type lectin domain-containing protein n=1 Tax=Maylandia zebra TaxID=106582 RepID=A0A3P9CAQ6_9CICH
MYTIYSNAFQNRQTLKSLAKISIYLFFLTLLGNLLYLDCNTRPFFCYRAIVVKQEKTWEEALEYCRKHHEDLASVASETEMLLIQKELSKHNTKEVVWIGLRFLSEDWLWVDREMMDYEAWSQGGKPLCPSTKTKCGALQVTRGTKGVWEAHNCEEKLQFICY